MRVNIKGSVYLFKLNRYCLNSSLSAYYNLQLYRGKSIGTSITNCSRPPMKKCDLIQEGLGSGEWELH